MTILSGETVQYQRYASGRWETVEAKALVEAPVALTVNGEPWLTLLCTPVDLEALAIGFLFNEGLLHTADEIASVRVCPSGDNVDVWLHHSLDKPERWRRTSGCTGGVTSDSPALPQALVDELRLSPESVNRLMSLLLEAQDPHRETRGMHTSALSDGQDLLIVAEDIGRHNTLDKISGRCLLEDVAPSWRILLTTGRISSEMLYKSARLGASVVISRTAPSSASIRLAERGGITLVGYARGKSFNVYTHPERIPHEG